MKLVKTLFALMALVVITTAGVSYWVFSALNAAHAHDKSSRYIRIEKGSSPKDVITQLKTEGVLAGSLPILIYLRIFGNPAKIQAGDYQFASPITPLQVIKELEKGEALTTRITIPEGFTRFDIAKRIAEKFGSPAAGDENKAGSVEMDEKSVLALMEDTSLIRDISPTAKNLEGYMYPTTYNLPRETRPAEVIKRMVEEFRKFWKPEWTVQSRAIGRTPHEIVTIASLVETETGIETERPIVAGIINNRLAKNIPLGIDQTNVYIAKMMGRWDGTINKSDLEVDSPYNTRTKTGIPPGPISSVTESSIKAALNPTPNDYIFYVRNVDLNDGSHWFYSSAAEFEKGKAKYQQWLEKERLEKRSSESNNN